MCNHYVAHDSPQLVAQLGAAWRNDAPPDLSEDLWPGRYGAVVFEEDGQRVADAMRWKLLVSDRKDAPQPHNARADKLTSPFYRGVWPVRRCLIPATAFYERHQTEKTEYQIAPAEGGLLVIAGIYNVWRPADAEPVWSYAMVTTSPSPWTASIHDRMPAILDGDARDRWLDPATPATELLHLLRPRALPLHAEPIG